MNPRLELRDIVAVGIKERARLDLSGTTRMRTRPPFESVESRRGNLVRERRFASYKIPRTRANGAAARAEKCSAIGGQRAQDPVHCSGRARLQSRAPL